MFTRIKTSSHEQGSLLVMALLIMLVLVILGTAVISLASMEKKISHYAYRELQAQEAADAGVEWALERTLQNLLDDDPATGPAGSADGSMVTPIAFGTGDDQISWEIVYTSEMPVDANEYTYTFTSKGTYRKDTPQEVSRTVLVDAVFRYEADEYKQGSINSYKME